MGIYKMGLMSWSLLGVWGVQTSFLPAPKISPFGEIFVILTVLN